jgi:superkiller protein 3
LTAGSANQDDDYRYLIYIYNGLSLQEMWKLEEANQNFDKAIEIHPDDPAPWLARAFGNRSLGKIEKAQQDARKAWDLCNRHIHIKPDSYAAYFDRAQANEILEDWDSALADYQTTKDKAPDLYIAYLGLSRIFIILNRFPEAEQAAREGIKLAESKGANPAWTYVHLAHIQDVKGDSSQARIAFEKAASLAPEVYYMHFMLGQFLETTGNPDDLITAEEEYKKSIAVSSDKASTHVDLARFYIRHDRFEEAIAEYHSALQYDRLAARTWTELAELLTRLERTDEARNTYQLAVEADPAHQYSRLSFGVFLYNLGEYEAAIREWESARQVGYNNCSLYLNLGQAYELLGDQDQAVLFYREAFSVTAEQNPACQKEAGRRLSQFAD